MPEILTWNGSTSSNGADQLNPDEHDGLAVMAVSQLQVFRLPRASAHALGKYAHMQSMALHTHPSAAEVTSADAAEADDPAAAQGQPARDQLRACE